MQLTINSAGLGRISHIFSFFLSLGILFSCKKETGLQDITTLNVVNAIVGSDPLIANINNQLPAYLAQPATGSGGFNTYYFTGGHTQVSLRQSSDTLHVLYDQRIDLPDNTIHSLFITGAVDAPESLLVEDKLPSHSDSTTGIRFINLSRGSLPVSINLAGNANGSEIASLEYKQITNFTNYAATTGITDYTFEFHDVASGDLLATYTLSNVGIADPYQPNYVRFKNLTIALIGEPGSQYTMQVNNY